MEGNEKTTDRDEAVKKIAELIADIRIAMLTTVAPDGSLHSRPMATQKAPFAGEALFLTRAHSGKVEDIEEDAEVSLSYADGKHAFVTLSGRAQITADRALIAELWNPMFKAWFPAGENDPEIRILTVRVEQAEYWDAPASALLRKVEVLARAVTGGKTEVGEHARVTL